MKHHLGDILSVLSGRNLSPSGMAGVLTLLHAVAGDEASVNLVRACDRTAAELRRRFPELAAIPVPADLNEWTTDAWISAMAGIYGEWHALADEAPDRASDTRRA